jgi:hypothetical protein
MDYGDSHLRTLYQVPFYSGILLLSTCNTNFDCAWSDSLFNNSHKTHGISDIISAIPLSIHTARLPPKADSAIALTTCAGVDCFQGKKKIRI